MTRLRVAVLAAALTCAVHASTVIVAPGTWDLSDGSGQLSSYPTSDDCVVGAGAAASGLTPGTYSYSCKTTTGVAVVVPHTGKAVLSWSPPVYKADGVTQSDATRYVVRYGTASNQYTMSLVVPASPATVTGLTSGTWYFKIYTIDVAGNESEGSVELNKTVQE